MTVQEAVLIQNAYKRYGDTDILVNLSMTVSKGTIYGLLGPSGCGKTTILNCIIGRKQLCSGSLWVLGGTPGTRESGIPGPRVGYMPQEMGLVAEFTVKDVIYYFGRLALMDEEDIHTRFRELSLLLEMPDDEKYIKYCSGGEQRRVSFAAALVQLPELLILDEPTVGLDPLLRHRIWNYLEKITQEGHVTVIITTHYIEEAKPSNKIGVMRLGKILAEDSPASLMHSFNTDSLEEVFLGVSKLQENNLDYSGSNNEVNTLQSSTVQLLNDGGDLKNDATRRKGSTNKFMFKKERLLALLDKNWKQFYRNWTASAFLMLFPLLVTLIFLVAVGNDVLDINIGMVNKEDGDCSTYRSNYTAIPMGRLGCKFRHLSCRFIDDLSGPMLKIVPLDSLQIGLEGIQHGKYVGVIHISENYSQALEERINSGDDSIDIDVSGSQIQVYLDMSNRQIGGVVKLKLFQIYLDYLKNIHADCKLPPNFGNLPVHFMDPVYGMKDEPFNIFMVPQVMIGMIFFITSLMTSQIITTERSEGVWDRSAVAGVTPLELTVSHILLQGTVATIQVLEVFAVIYFIFKVGCIGHVWIVLVLLIVQGVCGISFGFLVSIYFNNGEGSLIITGTFFLMTMVTGLLWPLDAMPTLLRWISSCFPFTVPCISIRNVMKKGWGLEHLEVLDGLLIEIAWIIFFTIISFVQLKRTQ